MNPPSLALTRVERVEQLGAEAHVTLRAGPDVLVARVRPGDEPAVGDSVGVSLDPVDAHLFDGDSGARLA